VISFARKEGSDIELLDVENNYSAGGGKIFEL
jgi:hypothetical protein